MWVRTILAGLPVCLLGLIGCTFPVRQQVDTLVCNRSSLSVDQAPAGEEKAIKMGQNAAAGGGVQQAQLLFAQGQDGQPKPKLDERLLKKAGPGAFPGADAPDISLPKLDPKAKDYTARIEVVIKEHYKPVAPPPYDKDFPPGPEGKPLSLADLEHIARSNCPLIRQAASDIEAARGAAQQAGAYPNPVVNYNATGAGVSGGPTIGGGISVTLKPFGKLKLAQDAAMESLKAAEFAYRRAETDLMWNVRGNYYNVLVAEESVRANRGLVELTDEVYRVMIDLLRNGEGVSASYEPAQMLVFTEQARVALVTARNQRLLAWRQLAAAMGTPHMPPTALAGNVHRSLPRLDFEKSLAHILTKHTDVLTTATAIDAARYNLRLARVSVIPDITVGASITNDLTAPGPSRLITGVNVSFPLGVFDQNKGNIRQSQAALVRAIEEPHRVDAALTASFADAFRRYEENRVLLEMYEKTILPKQVQSFRGAVKRHFGGPVGDVAFTDLISSEQNLITVIGNYLPILANQWQAVADVSSWLQTDQVYMMAEEMEAAPAVNFDELLKLEHCHHPCSPVMPTPTPESFKQRPEAGPLASALGAPTSNSAAAAKTPTIVPAAAVVTPPASPAATPQTNAPAPQTRDVIRAGFGPLSRTGGD